MGRLTVGDSANGLAGLLQKTGNYSNEMRDGVNALAKAQGRDKAVADARSNAFDAAGAPFNDVSNKLNLPIKLGAQAAAIDAANQAGGKAGQDYDTKKPIEDLAQAAKAKVDADQKQKSDQAEADAELRKKRSTDVRRTLLGAYTVAPYQGPKKTLLGM